MCQIPQWMDNRKFLLDPFDETGPWFGELSLKSNIVTLIIDIASDRFFGLV